MWSYKSDRGRVPRPRHFMSQTRNASSPVTTSSAKTSALKSPDQQTTTTTKTGPSSQTSRSLSCSEAEEARPVTATARPKPSKIPSSNDVRLSLLPRPTVNPTSPIYDNSSQTADRSSQQIGNSEKQIPAKGRSENTLRRKAPTIGKPSTQESQTTETERPERLRVVIPSTPRPGHFTNTNATPRMPWGQAEMVKNESSSSSIPPAQAAGKSTEPPALEGPKELASLRTTLNTQNLPPSTLSSYPSASTPSTRYSSSPGIWSRGSTPTSMSSCSPGIVYPSKVGPRLRQISPSETKLPVLSPLTQYPSPQSDLAERMSIRSPKLDKGTESNTSLANAERGETPKSTDSTKLPGSALPRRTSINSSNIPGRIKVDTQTNRQSGDKTERRTSGIRGVQSPAIVTKSKDSVPTPSRPTREGTDQLELEPSPVIQSHLPPKTVSNHKRRESSENNVPTAKQLTSSSSQSAATSTDSFHSRKPSRKSSLTTSPVTIPQKFSRTSSREQQGKQDTKSPTTPTSASSKRFGIFSRKPKPETDTHGSDQSRLPRKGPAAGTGHEGYKKYAQSGRKSSVGSSSGAKTRSTSVSDSVPKLASGSKGNGKGRPEQEIDDFLRSRLEPVVINGGGVDGTTLTRTESEQSMGASSTVSASNTAQNVLSPHSTVCSTETLATSGTTGEPRRRKGSNDDGSAGQSRLPAAKKIFHHVTASNSSVDHPKTILPRTSSQGKEQKHSKKGKGLRSFFQRSHSKQRKESNPEAPASSAPHLHAKITPVAANRPVAHYALFDTDEDPLEGIVHSVEESPPTEYEDEPDQPVEIPPALNIQKNRQSVLLPSLPGFQTEHHAGRNSPPKVYMNKNFGFSNPKTEKSPKEKRPSRLASIGRIPQVISRRDRQHKPASQSFSRPFSITESPSIAAPVTDLPNESQAPTADAEKSPGKPSNLGFDLTQPFGDPTQGSVLDLLAGPYSENEFLHFSPDKNSSLSSGDSGAATGAPNPNAEPADDEIWKEYDDLIDHVFSPVTPSTEPGSGLSDSGDNFELAALASKTLQAELNAHRELPPLPTLVEHPSVGANRSSGDSVRLRRSKIASALRSSYAPSSQPSYGDLNAVQSDHQYKDGTEKSDLDHSLSHSIQPIEEASFLPSPLNPSQSFEACRQRNTILFDIAERDREGPTAQTNIRSGSLMTSRWLSFGRVLFSPAHNHVKTGEQERILVIDGLGNDDWSFYCALTYANADVYNLHVGPNAATSSHPAAWQPPANYHTVHHPNLADKFPFPMGFFAATVLRFPAACSEHVQDSIVSECKRVLRPGGYMEMSILDLDMVNMGIRTRKAVRGLKERTYLADSNISLKPASDSIQRLLGRHNFDNLHRCMVRIPAAGVITRSSASSSSTSSSSLHPSMSIPAAIRSAPSFGQGHEQTEPTSITTTTTTTANYYHHHNHDDDNNNNNNNNNNNKHGKSPSNDTDLSLGDLLSDPIPSQSNDESIRKIVAKVGRWWYTRCYEIPVLPDGDVDLRIWSDKKVLRECQKRGTGFRLLIAHAQKPSEVNRRTASV